MFLKKCAYHPSTNFQNKIYGKTYPYDCFVVSVSNHMADFLMPAYYTHTCTCTCNYYYPLFLLLKGCCTNFRNYIATTCRTAIGSSLYVKLQAAFFLLVCRAQACILLCAMPIN